MCQNSCFPHFFVREIPMKFLENSKKFNLEKPVAVADAACCPMKISKALEANKYEYILEARLKNETVRIKEN